MQFTSSFVSLLLAAATTGVQALPSSPIEQRQEAPRLYVKFWSDTSCGADGGFWVEDTVWLQEPVGTCIDVEVWRDFGSTEIVTNTATHDRMSSHKLFYPSNKLCGHSERLPC